MNLFRRTRKAIREVKKMGGQYEAIVPYKHGTTEMKMDGMCSTWIRHNSVWIAIRDGRIKLTRLGSFDPLSMWRSTAGKINSI